MGILRKPDLLVLVDHCLLHMGLLDFDWQLWLLRLDHWPRRHVLSVLWQLLLGWDHHHWRRRLKHLCGHVSLEEFANKLLLSLDDRSGLRRHEMLRLELLVHLSLDAH